MSPYCGNSYGEARVLILIYFEVVWFTVKEEAQGQKQMKKERISDVRWIQKCLSGERILIAKRKTELLFLL